MALSRGRRLVDQALAEMKATPELQQLKGREFSLTNEEKNCITSLNEHSYSQSPVHATTSVNTTSNDEATSSRPTVEKDSSDSDSPLFSDVEEHKDYSPSSDFSEDSSSDEKPKKKRRMKKIINKFQQEHVAVVGQEPKQKRRRILIKKFQQEHVAVIGQELKNYTLQPNIGQEPGSSTDQEHVVFEQIDIDGNQLNANSGIAIQDREGEENVNEVQKQGIRAIGQKRRRSRKGLSDRNQWQRQVNKEKRMRGESYKGLKKINGEFTLSVDKEGRKMKCRCTCKWSSKSTNSLSCSSLQEEDREKMFRYFWNVLSDWSGRKAYISSLIERKKITKRRKTSTLTDSTKRNVTYKYNLIKDNMRINVCKKMFLHTLDVGERSVRSWLQELSHDNAEFEENIVQPVNVDDPAASIVSSKRRRPSVDAKSRSVEEFFQGLPKMESHYCRASSKKMYLEPVWENKVALFKEYKQNFCVDNGTSASWSVFSRVMYKLNIDLFQPKKDQCETCLKHKLGTLSDDEFKLHQNKKDKSRAEKEKDKERALSSESLGVYTVDVQAVLLLPKIMSSSAYYKTKLKLHNYTVYNMKNAEVDCFLWHEANGGLESDVFASILYKFLQKEINEKKLSEIIIWSDGCAYQNRCEKVSNALLYLSNVNKVTISQKYLEVGHTHMEVDSVHSKIEKKIKGKELYVPFDYVRMIREARTKPTEFNVAVLKYSDFLDFSNGYYNSVRPGLKKGDPVVTDVSAFRYYEGYIYFKTDLEEDWQALPRRPKTINVYDELNPLYKTPIKITTRKFEDLQSLKKVISEDYHNFYDTLPHECSEKTDKCKHIVQ